MDYLIQSAYICVMYYLATRTIAEILIIAVAKPFLIPIIVNYKVKRWLKTDEGKKAITEAQEKLIDEWEESIIELDTILNVSNIKTQDD